MRNSLSLVFSLAALVAVALAAALLEPAWAHDLSLDGWTLDELLFARQRRTEELNEVTTCTKQQYEERRRAVQNLHDGRATLFEAAIVFRGHNRNRGNTLLQHYFPQSAYQLDDEQVCQQVILCVKNHISPQDAAQLVPRLEEELRQHKERYGTVTLPEQETGTQ